MSQETFFVPPGAVLLMTRDPSWMLVTRLYKGLRKYVSIPEKAISDTGRLVSRNDAIFVDLAPEDVNRILDIALNEETLENSPFLRDTEIIEFALTLDLKIADLFAGKTSKLYKLLAVFRKVALVPSAIIPHGGNEIGDHITSYLMTIRKTKDRPEIKSLWGAIRTISSIRDPDFDEFLEWFEEKYLDSFTSDKTIKKTEEQVKLEATFNKAAENSCCIQ